MLRWKSLTGLRLGNIGGRQNACMPGCSAVRRGTQLDERLPSPDVFHKHRMGEVVAESSPPTGT